ncbi:MAG: hypothetical protein K0M50_17585 [Prolixibacteraceae bacterium]|nr:hypothetical protein [Prolixibacteraceae bacterium]
MRYLFFFFFAVISGFANSQSIVRQELTVDEIKYLATDIIDGFGSPDSKDYENSVINNLKNYDFEILYNDKIIYRGVINKPSLAGFDFVRGRNKVSFCFEYDMFDADTKLELAEGGKFKLSTAKEGKKYLWADHYELFCYEKYHDKLTVNDTIARTIKLKFYKIEYRN